MISRQDPEYWRYRYEKKVIFDSLFLERVIGEDTYLVSMQLAGFSPRESKNELALLRQT